MRKSQTGKHSAGYLAKTPQDCQGHEKRKTDRGYWGDMTTKCNVEPWTGSWDRKGTLVEERMKSK